MISLLKFSLFCMEIQAGLREKSLLDGVEIQ